MRTWGGEKTLSISYLVDVAKDSVPVLSFFFLTDPVLTLFWIGS